MFLLVPVFGMVPASINNEGVTLQGTSFKRRMNIVYSGGVEVFSLKLTGNKEVLNKLCRQDDCQEVGSLQSFLADEKENRLTPFRITILLHEI